MINFTGKWIEFTDISIDTQKTKRFMVNNKENSNALGEIKWYGGFRKYSFFSFPDIVYEEQCLRDIATFLQLLMDERKNNNQ